MHTYHGSAARKPLWARHYSLWPFRLLAGVNTFAPGRSMHAWFRLWASHAVDGPRDQLLGFPNIHRRPCNPSTACRQGNLPFR
ncbi:hypothetical protein CPAR01_03279 [Colletotrichum paranaense]|uniref:Uncharacterized protein n=1 Tax=Colletotrichum paranaense TaxID=1914294 RepID=A0ABQ9T1X7_9PEZI|nr:uncharacterized protein CPAR01_03279 [Colletotrichum paranaense]KAK1545777.1 hypothetical protein CPAR01_03279 [Colletotrichum paranaense]